MRSIDMTGERYGRLVCIKTTSFSKSRWICKCDCGNTTEAIRSNLIRGVIKSCGCLQDEVRQQNGLNARRHGQSSSRSPVYRTWEAMRGRCNNPNSDWFHRYGGRGIKVCERWNSFENFYEDMGERPEEMTIDRINPNGNYEPDNCKWSTYKEQSANKDKTNSKITKEGAAKIRLDTRTLSAIAKEWSVGTSTIHRIRNNKTHLS